MLSLKVISRSATLAARNSSQRVVFPTINGYRFQSTSVDKYSDEAAVAKAESFIKLFPGSNLIAKSSSAVAIASIAAFLISKEIFLIDAELFEAFSLFGAYYIWYSGGKEGAAAYLREKKETIKRVLEEARTSHKKLAEDSMKHYGKFQGAEELTKAVWSVAKNNVELEQKVYELKQKIQFQNEIKNTLEARARHEQTVREGHQKKLAAFVIAEVEKSLENPKVQDAILSESIQQIQNFVAKN